MDENVAADKFIANIEKFEQYDLSGYVIFGSTGEAAHLTDEEKLALLTELRKNSSTRKQLIAGTGLASTHETINFTRKVADIGVDYALVVTPNYYQNQAAEEGMKRHYLEVADNSPIPILLYNVPMFTAVDLSADLIESLSAHSNIIGIKDSTDKFSKITEIIALQNRSFAILIGSILHSFMGYFLGVQGAVLAMANIVPQHCVQIYRNCLNKSYAEARSKFLEVVALQKKIVKPFGIAGVKAALDVLGFFGGHPRLPLRPLDGEQMECIKSELTAFKLT